MLNEIQEESPQSSSGVYRKSPSQNGSNINPLTEDEPVSTRTAQPSLAQEILIFLSAIEELFDIPSNADPKHLVYALELLQLDSWELLQMPMLHQLAGIQLDSDSTTRLLTKLKDVLTEALGAVTALSGLKDL